MNLFQEEFEMLSFFAFSLIQMCKHLPYKHIFHQTKNNRLLNRFHVLFRGIAIEGTHNRGILINVCDRTNGIC